MKFTQINFEYVKDYLVCTDEDKTEVDVYIVAAKSYVKTYTALTDEELDASDYFVMPVLMLIAHFYENKSTEMSGKLNAIYNNLLNLGKVHSL